METFKEVSWYGVSYRGCNVRRLIYRVLFMEINIEVKMYRDSYRGKSIWRQIKRVQCMETQIEVRLFGVHNEVTMHFES